MDYAMTPMSRNMNQGPLANRLRLIKERHKLLIIEAREVDNDMADDAADEDELGYVD
jgi:hypothetical protein